MGKDKKQGEQWAKLRVWIAEHLVISSVGVLILFLLAGYLLVFAPELRRIKQANITQSLELERQAKNAYLSKLNKLAENYAAVSEDDVERLLDMLPTEEDIPGLLATFEASTNASDVGLTSINFAKGEGGPIAGVGTVVITLGLEHANYKRFKIFLDALEKNLRLFDVAGVTLNPSGAQYNLSIRAYTQL